MSRDGLRWLVVAGLSAAFGIGAVQPAAAGAALEGDFGAGADRIDFDELSLGQGVDFQWRLKGVVIPPDPGGPFRVVGSAELGGAAVRSVPYALRSPTDQHELRIEFLSPRERAGMSIGGFTGPLDATLEAYGLAGSLLDSVTLSFAAAGAPDVDHFIGVDVGSVAIRRLVLRYSAPAEIVVDDLLAEPSQADSVPSPTTQEAILNDPNLPEASRVAAINELARSPSEAGATVLRNALTGVADPYLLERVAIALSDLSDASALEPLIELATTTTNGDVYLASRTAAAVIQERFPLKNPPQVAFSTAGTLEPNTAFDVVATVTSPADFSWARVDLRLPKQIDPSPSDLENSYSGQLVAGTPVTVGAAFIGVDAGYREFSVSVNLSPSLEHPISYEFRYYVDLQPGGGTASATPPVFSAEEVPGIEFLELE